MPKVHVDSTADFLREGYLFGTNRFEELGTDLFRTHLLGRPITVLRGIEAARFFYEDDRFTRTGALPTSVVHSLQDEGSVQTLDGRAHRGRKRRFTRVLDEAGDADLVEAFDWHWREVLRRWRGNTLEFLPEIDAVLLAAVLSWLNVHETPERRAALTTQVAAMIDGAGSFGPRNWWGRYLRRSAERWAKEIARHSWAHPRERVTALVEGLDDDVAAVELLNVVRPVVAVGRFIAFAALALNDAPSWREQIPLRPGAAHAFTQEVRRLAPFFPAIAGRARADAEFDGTEFLAGDWVMLDLFATNHHPRHWHRPWVFDPNRYEREPEQGIVSQGAGKIATTHRCPGEPVTVALMERAVRLLSDVPWHLPEQPQRTDLSRFPANPGGKLLVAFDA